MSKTNEPKLDYVVVEKAHPTELRQIVLKYIADGYEPLGGVSTTVTQGNYLLYTQALIKKL